MKRDAGCTCRSPSGDVVYFLDSFTAGSEDYPGNFRARATRFPLRYSLYVHGMEKPWIH